VGTLNPAWRVALRNSDSDLLTEGDLVDIEVLGALGQGSQAVVYRVRRDGHEYALKVLRAASVDEAALRAFHREAALLACVDHSGIPRVHEVGSVRQRSYLVMDLVRGRSLAEHLGAGLMPIPRVVEVATDIATALDAAHRSGVVHRDVKPDNVVLDENGNPRLIDFGLATQAIDEVGDSVVGTMTYGAPEQSGMLKRPVDARADLYSLGVVLFECLTGTPPFTSADIGEVIRMHATLPAPDVRSVRPEVPAALAGIVAKLLAKDPDDRYQSAAGLVFDLRRLAEDPEVDLVLGTVDQPTSQREPVLVGRDGELDTLRRLWREIVTGNGSAVLVTGPAGCGKSRLVSEFLKAAYDRGNLVLTGRSTDGVVLPFEPLRDAVEQHVAAVETLPEPERPKAVERLRTAAGADAALLATLSPRLGAVLGLESPEDAERDSSQFVLAVTSFLTGLARTGGPTVLHLDDVQWLDEATVQVLARIATQLDEVPLLVVAAGRNDSDSAAVLDTLRSRLAESLATTLELAPLTAGSVSRILADLSGGMSVSDEVAAMVAARTSGNALALHEYLVSLMHSGLLRPSWGTWELDVEHLDDLPLAGSAVDLVIKRLDDLEQDTRSLLGIAALLGSSFSADFLTQVCNIDPRRITRIIDEATWAHLLEPRGGDRHAFLHNCVREAFLAQFDEESLRQHHQRIADVLIQNAAPDPQTVYATALHSQAGLVERHERQVFRANVAAGKLALTEHAPVQAVRFFEQAEAVATDAGSEFYWLLGTAQHRAGRFVDAVEALHKALAASDDVMERAEILRLTAVVHDSTWDSVGEISAAEQGLAELGCRLPSRRSHRAAFRLALIASLLRSTPGMGKADGWKREKYRLLSNLYRSLAMGYRRELEPRLSTLFSLREIQYGLKVGTSAETVRARARQAVLTRSSGRERWARAFTARALRGADQLGDQRLRAYVEWTDAMSTLNRGGDDGSRLRRVLDEKGQWLNAGEYLDALAVLCWDSLLHGDTTAAEVLFQHRRERVGVEGQGGRNATVAAEAGLLALQGHAVDAAEHLKALRERPDPPRWERVDVLIAALICAIEQGDFGETVNETLAEFAALRLAPTAILPAQQVIYVYQAYCRLEQARLADVADRPERLRLAATAVAALGRLTTRPLVTAHYRLLRATLLQLGGEQQKALHYLDRYGADLLRVDAPLVAYEAARIRARALGALGHAGEADRQARYALAVADEYQWPRRVRWVKAEFSYSGSTAFSQQSMSVGHSSVRIHTHEGIPCSVFRHRLAALEQVSFAASRVGNPDDLARTTLDETIKMLHAERAVLFLLEGDPGRLVPFAARDAAGNDLGEFSDYSTTLVDRVCQSQEAAVITSAGDGTEVDSGSVVIHGLRSIMAAPLQLDGRLLGVVYLDSRIAKGIFTNEDVGALTAVTNYVAGALETARATQLEVEVDNANRQRDLAEALRRSIAELSGTLDPGDVLRRLLQSVVRVLGGEEGWLLRPEGEGWTVRAALTRDLPEPGTPPATTSDALLRRLLDRGVPVVGEPGTRRPDILDSATDEVRSWMSIPVRREADKGRKAEQIGLIVIASTEAGRYRPEHADLAATLAGQGLIAFDKALLYARVQRLATTDELTRIANRRHFFTLATRAFANVRQNRRPLAAMMIDIDHFKKVNDTYGHQVGDEVIRSIADRFRRSIRTGDILGRYGGEEFALVLQGGGDVRATAERIRVAVADEPVQTKAGPLPITISVGAAVLRPEDADVGVLLGRADAHLYDAKQSGRNRVCAEEQPESEGPTDRGESR
jgi:diguanylate cyclase (GGDEF)-like protein